MDRKQVNSTEEIKRVLKDEILAVLNQASAKHPVVSVDGEPEVILVVGVNGTARPPPSASFRTSYEARQKRSVVRR